jgi:hypothetical protein
MEKFIRDLCSQVPWQFDASSVRWTIIVTNWCIQRHPLRRADGDWDKEPGEETDAPIAHAIALDAISSDEE